MTERKSSGPPKEVARRGGETTKARNDPDYFKRIGRLGGLAKARSKSAEADAIREQAARGEIG